MREIHRTIVSAVVFSKDGKVLMGRKDPSKGGVYPDAWHIPGGGIEEGETKESALGRELQEEVGISLEGARIVPIPTVGNGTAEKTLADGERVLCHMEFHRFEVHLDAPASDITIKSDGEFRETRWFGREELAEIEQIPGGREFFMDRGYIRQENISSEFNKPLK